MGGSTSDAAAYSPGLCKHWAAVMAEVVAADNTRGKVLDDDDLKAAGVVKRHYIRGPVDEYAREAREREDQACQAGMRNQHT